jgi:DNA polymerase III delta prime subunit
MTTKIPLVEAFRPSRFEDIVLDPNNKLILSRIIETSYFPNLLFYGPPGTGKTTTIINLINAYQQKIANINKELVIHLNASDERGIDIIRNQISSFVNSKPLFCSGLKFVILDEVDYMTKNAQQALRYLIQDYASNVRFCLICNYISRIDEGLQNEFIRLRFNQLPPSEIIDFLMHISDSEKMNMSREYIEGIQKLYKSDIRSMINYMQTNQGLTSYCILNDDIWLSIIDMIKNKDKQEDIFVYIHNISMKYNIDKKNIVKLLLNYVIKNKEEYVTCRFLSSVENVLHTDTINNELLVNYVLNMLSETFI